MDPLGFGNFNATPLNRKATPTPQKKSGGLVSGAKGFLKGLVQAPEYFIKTDILNPAVENIAMLKGDKAVQAEAQRNSMDTIGHTPEQAIKRLAGNTTQLAGTAVVPGGGGLGSRVLAGAGSGALIGGGSAMANDQDVVKGTLEGAALGGILPVGSKITGLDRLAGRNRVPSTTPFRENLRTQGQQAQGRTLGINAGVVGKEVITPQDTERMLGTLDSYGIKSGNANNALRDVQANLDTYGKQIGTHFEGIDAPLAKKDVDKLTQEYLDQLHTTDPRVVKEAEFLVNDAKKDIKSEKGIWEFRKGLDNKTPESKLGGNMAVSSKIAAIKDMRQFLAKKLGDVPGMSNYHELSELKPLVAKEANRLNNPPPGITGRLAASGPVQKTENNLGKVMQKLAGPSKKTLPPNDVVKMPNSILGNLIRPAGLASRQGLTASVGLPPENQPPAEAPLTGDAGTADLVDSLTAPNPDQTAEDANDPFGSQSIRQAILQDLEQNGGKNVSTLLSLYKTFGQTGSSTNPSVGKPTAQQYGLAQTGVSSLNQLAQMIEENPSILEKNATPGQGIPLIGSLISNAAGASGYHALADSILSSLIHLQTGATATKEEVTAAHGQLPQPGDPPEVRSQKIQTLMQNFQPFLGKSGGASTNLQDLLANQ